MLTRRTPHRRWIAAWMTMAIAAVILVDFSAAADRTKSPRRQKREQPTRLPLASLRDSTEMFEVAGVRPEGRGDAKQAASEIDRLIADALPDDVAINPKTDDATFVRRVYLDIAGRIPTLEEVDGFLQSTATDKRIDLIDQLLSSQDYVSHYYNFWADTLRLNEQPVNNQIATPYLSYVRDSIAANRPYNTWVREMLTADGRIWENPAAGFQLRDDGMPLVYVDNTVRVFLGTQIGCAQCHDHPFDGWSQHQFYELAAMTAGTRTRYRRGEPGFEMMGGGMKRGKGQRGRIANPTQRLIEEAKAKYPSGKVPGPFQRLVRANSFKVTDAAARLRLPDDYAYNDAKPKSVVEPAVLWGEIPESAKGASPREQLAAWITDDANEAFANTIANRLWKQTMGVGLVEPIDDFRDDHPPSNPALLQYLSSQIVAQQYDLKQFIRAVFYSDAYQAESVNYEPSSGVAFDFRGPTVRRMTAEQVWDSLLTMAVRNTLPFRRPDAADMEPVMDLDFATATFDSVETQSKRYADTYFTPIYNRGLREYSFQGIILCRASELPTPLPGDHFLRQFGQGDRDVINGADDSATVPQILAMFNGPITHVMLQPGSRIVTEVTAIDDPVKRVDAIFKSVLSRPPSPSDRRLARAELAQMKVDEVAYGNIIWALLNTREFLFVQ